MAKSKETKDTAKKTNMKIEIETGSDKEKTSQAEKEQKEKPDAAAKKPDTTNDRSGQKQPDADTGKASDAQQQEEEKEETQKTPQESLAEEKDKYLRLAAEYDNFRKRTAKERDSIYSNAKADVIGKLLPVYDNLERALKLKCSDEAYYKGIEMTMQQLTEILKTMNIEPIPTLGEVFDPNRHNAIVRIEDPELGEGIIAEECKKGFMMGERIIRFSDVVVAN